MRREGGRRGEEGREDQSLTEEGVVMTYRHNWFTMYVPDHVRNILC